MMKQLRNNRIFLLSILILIFVLPGCFLFSTYYTNPQTGKTEKSSQPPPIQLRPFGYKKLRKKTIHLPGTLARAMRKYRVEKNTFPSSWELFSESSTEAMEAIKDLDAGGYTDLYIDYWSLDSCSLSWEHPHVYNQTPTPQNGNIQASGWFLFTFKDSLYLTDIKFRRR